VRFKLVLSESLRSLGANLSTTVAATMTVLIGMFLLGLVVALGSWAQDFGDKQKDKLLVKVYFCTETSGAPCKKPASEPQINAVRQQLVANPLVERADFVSKAEALERMRKLNKDIVENLTSNPLPDAFEVKAKDGANVKAISADLRQGGLPPGVEKIRDGEEVSERIVTVARWMSASFAVATLVLLVSSALLIANTIRLSIFSRRREIEVMKLVGATNWFVRGPFMLEGLITGLIGSLAAVLLLLLAKTMVLARIDIETSSDVAAWPFRTIALIIVVVGLTVGAVGSGITLRRFLQV
jgi:cell division transport system permease protein